jgi:hypothetical protein
VEAAFREGYRAGISCADAGMEHWAAEEQARKDWDISKARTALKDRRTDGPDETDRRS